MDDLNCVVTNIIPVSPIMKIIRVKPLDWDLPEYKAGQFVALALYGSAAKCESATEEFKEQEPDKLIKRAYSIASSSTQDYVEFYITLVHSGSLTPRIFALEIGDKIWMGKKAVGMFTLDQVAPERNVVLIATGTGVAPYMSMLRSNALSRKGKVMVIHGASNSWDLGYSSELSLLETMFDNFSYHPTITMIEKEPAGWSGDTRYIDAIWKDETIEKAWGFKASPEHTEIFLCGNPNMTNGMTEILESEGYNEHKKKTPGQIHIEKF